MSKVKSKQQKIPVVRCVDSNGQIQCPFCWRFFNMPGEQDYKAGICECPWCGRDIQVSRAAAETGNRILRTLCGR